MAPPIQDNDTLRGRVRDTIRNNIRAGLLPVDWIYDQSTGALLNRAVCYPDADAAARDLPNRQTPAPHRGGVGSVYPGNYAGHGAGVNNPAMDGAKHVGPLPSGGYDIGPMGTHGGGRLRNAMPLTPLESNDMKGRDAFLIHGGDMQSRGSSAGCIVTPPAVRDDVLRSGDRRLWVVPEGRRRPPT